MCAASYVHCDICLCAGAGFASCKLGRRPRLPRGVHSHVWFATACRRADDVRKVWTTIRGLRGEDEAFDPRGLVKQELRARRVISTPQLKGTQTMLKTVFALALLSLAGQAAPRPAEAGRTTLDSALFERLEFRSIGPASMGGRITDVEGIPGNPALVYAATASGV